MNTILLQAAVSELSGIASVFVFLFSLATAIVIFLLFRGVMLWYWRVDTIVRNQEKQIDQMNTIIRSQNIMIDGLNAIWKNGKEKVDDSTEDVNRGK
ncbi:hypothetical protein FAZ19_09935 [Sphingobacterium alkalisoli]|uniref:Uncharacterized protein n=1 Tax=Sphingobacterium alkalisoli TaxID=1874115 RepID=A0A4U0H2Y7_9SPHI|nr:hypothetical protein [Sphingobacterium alkalisoli]TJY65454.1 hypothetical protein FAZ19_09935 [Sphingobacterium alkalisoli]GGH20367.1 hypothetical protein GCM10011418_25500 [Sphingobacterium alkalisoli]